MPPTPATRTHRPYGRLYRCPAPTVGNTVGIQGAPTNKVTERWSKMGGRTLSDGRAAEILKRRLFEATNPGDSSCINLQKQSLNSKL